VGPERAQNMVKRVVKVYLSEMQMDILNRICQSLGMTRSSFFEHRLEEYARSINLVRERVHSGKKIQDCPRKNVT